MQPSQDSRTRLVQTALKLFGGCGYHNTSIADILRESGCTRGVLYYYFSSKEELGYAVIGEMLRLVAEQGAASHLQTNEHPIDRLIKTLDALPSVVRVGATDVPTAGMSARIAAVHEGFRARLETTTKALVDGVRELLRRGVAEGVIRDSADPVVLAHVFVTMAMGIQYESVLTQEEVIWEDAKRWLKEYLNSLRA
jgi:AcrR family transcriptional regulator